MSEVKRYFIHTTDLKNINDDWFHNVEMSSKNLWDSGQVVELVHKEDYEKLQAQLENKSKDYGCFSMKELPSEKIKIVPSAYANEIPVLLLSFESYNYLLKHFKEKEQV